MRDLFVRRVYHSYGINIVVDLDFVKKTVSLVEKNGKSKSYKFSERTPEYLNGWRAILKAMEHAIAEAQKEMDAFEEKEHKEFVKLFMALDKSLEKGEGNLDAPGEN